ncbi:hypothetical protein C8J57DRAFT_1228455 [Mycena rebaudengoi]|nr:hypothetical protein C8J57DRAFT_1228455 [Mycena rebaudengoi]
MPNASSTQTRVKKSYRLHMVSTRDLATIIDSRNRQSVRDTHPAAYHEARARQLESESALNVMRCEVEAATWNVARRREGMIGDYIQTGDSNGQPEIGGKFRQEIQVEIGNELNGNGKRTTVKPHRSIKDLRKLNGRGEELAQTLSWRPVGRESYAGRSTGETMLHKCGRGVVWQALVVLVELTLLRWRWAEGEGVGSEGWAAGATLLQCMRHTGLRAHAVSSGGVSKASSPGYEIELDEPGMSICTKMGRKDPGAEGERGRRRSEKANT